jgi:hypothetical protein
VLVGGMAIGTLFTLFVIPSIYMLVARDHSTGLICGIIGAVLALFFQRLAIAIGGFVAGSTIALHLTLMMGTSPARWWP